MNLRWGVVRYVAGFVVTPDSVLLVHKTHPAALAGSWNAVGGKVNLGEEPVRAMEREFKEETGCTIFPWRHYVTLRGRYALEGTRRKRFEVLFFVAHVGKFFPTWVKNDVGEPLAWHDVDTVLTRNLSVLPNVPWLLAMALSFKRGERAAGFTVEERYVV